MGVSWERWPREAVERQPKVHLELSAACRLSARRPLPSGIPDHLSFLCLGLLCFLDCQPAPGPACLPQNSLPFPGATNDSRSLDLSVNCCLPLIHPPPNHPPSICPPTRPLIHPCIASSVMVNVGCLILGAQCCMTPDKAAHVFESQFCDKIKMEISGIFGGPGVGHIRGLNTKLSLEQVLNPSKLFLTVSFAF